MNKEQLLKACPNVSAKLADLWLPDLNLAMERYSIDTPIQQACFMPQVLHESGFLTSMVENLNYRPQVLMQKFRGRFTPQQAGELGYLPGRRQADQEAVANIAYANRYGNGDAESGDGWRYRGHGPFQLTFRDNYLACMMDIDVDIVSQPELLLKPRAGSRSAAWFWARGNRTGRSLNALADMGKVDLISRAINGGDNGLEERIRLTHRFLEILK